MSDANRETATLAGGCFWGVQELTRELPGVIATTVGAPTYDHVKKGSTGHAEAVKIVFDPSTIAYEEILRFFFRMHDPTQRNRQMNDVGTQYRSAIFVHSEEQRATAERVKGEVGASGKWPRPIATEIVPAAAWYDAEDYHQDYLKKNPWGYNCHFVRD